MTDIEVVLDFDHSQDHFFSGGFSNSQPGSEIAVQGRLLPLLDPYDEKSIFDTKIGGGWFGAWGKELSGLDSSQVGGNALLGKWVFVRKHIDWCPHPFDTACLVPDKITLHATVENFGPNSPVVFVFNVDRARLAIVIGKDTQFAPPTLVVNQVFKNMKVPFPANAPYATLATYTKMVDVSNLAGQCSTSSVTARIEVSKGLNIEHVATDVNGTVVSVEEPGQPANGVDPSYYSLKSAIQTAVKFIEKKVSNGLVFDPEPVSKRGKRGQGFTSGDLFDFATTAATASRSASANHEPTLGKFFEPLELAGSLPTLPHGVNWVLNARGLVLASDGRELYMPHELFNLQEMRARHAKVISSAPDLESTETLGVEIDRVERLFEYMKSVGNGISMNYELALSIIP